MAAFEDSSSSSDEGQPAGLDALVEALSQGQAAAEAETGQRRARRRVSAGPSPSAVVVGAVGAGGRAAWRLLQDSRILAAAGASVGNLAGAGGALLASFLGELLAILRDEARAALGKKRRTLRKKARGGDWLPFLKLCARVGIAALFSRRLNRVFGTVAGTLIAFALLAVFFDVRDVLPWTGESLATQIARVAGCGVVVVLLTEYTGRDMANVFALFVFFYGGEDPRPLLRCGRVEFAMLLVLLLSCYLRHHNYNSNSAKMDRILSEMHRLPPGGRGVEFEEGEIDQWVHDMLRLPPPVSAVWLDRSATTFPREVTHGFKGKELPHLGAYADMLPARYFQTSARGDYTAVFSQDDDVHITMDVEMET